MGAEALSGCCAVSRWHAACVFHINKTGKEGQEESCSLNCVAIWAKKRLLQEYGADAEGLAEEMAGRLAEAEPLLW